MRRRREARRVGRARAPSPAEGGIAAVLLGMRSVQHGTRRSMSEGDVLPASVRVLERGWLSSNNVLLFDDDGQATIVDTGYVTHRDQTVALVRHALAGTSAGADRQHAPALRPLRRQRGAEAHVRRHHPHSARPRGRRRPLGRGRTHVSGHRPAVRPIRPRRRDRAGQRAADGRSGVARVPGTGPRPALAGAVGRRAADPDFSGRAVEQRLRRDLSRTGGRVRFRRAASDASTDRNARTAPGDPRARRPVHRSSARPLGALMRASTRCQQASSAMRGTPPRSC